MGPRKGAAKASRHKKSYWRKGTAPALKAVEEGLAAQRGFDAISLPEDAITIDRSSGKGNKAAKAKPPRLRGQELQESLYPQLHPHPLTKAAKTTKKHRASRWGKSGQADKPLPKPRKLKGKEAKEEEEDVKPELSPSRFDAIKGKGKIPSLAKVKFNEMETVTADLWSTPMEESTGNLEAHCADHYLRQTKRRQPHKPRTPLPKSSAPAVVVAPPSASYNPTFTDHQDALAAVAVAEARRERRAKALDASLRPRRESIVTAEERREEEAQGLFHDGKDEDEVEEESETEEKGEPIPPSKAEIAAKAAKEAAKADKRRTTELFRAKAIVKELKSAEDAQALKLKKRAARKARLELKPRKLSRKAFVEPEGVWTATEELAGSLRLLRPKGDALAERAVSLQRRSLLPVSERRKRSRTYRRKRVEAREHRVVGLDYKPI